MISQKKIIREVNWDILLVLDACRYDYFEKYSKDILKKGVLHKCASPSTFTLGWIKEIFNYQGIYNIIYISTDPVVQNIRDIEKRAKHGNNFDMRDHFKRVIDLYSTDFEKPGFVYPSVVNQALDKVIEEYPKDRIVVKYWPVHDPYMYYLEPNDYDFDISPFKFGNIRKIIYELISDEVYWTIRKKLNFKPENWLEGIWRKYGRDGIVRGYTEDLLTVLHACQEVIDKYPNKTIAITSDHGERLGPRYSHGGRRNKEITEIPWYRCLKET